MTAIVCLVVLCGTVVRAAVIIAALPEPMLIRDEFFGHIDPVDIDHNGTIDFSFGSSFSGVGLRTEAGNRAVVTLDPAPNIGGPPYQLPLGYVIGSVLTASGFDNPLWASSDFLGGYVSPGENAFMGIVQVLSTGSSSSFNGRGPIGIEFEAADGIHYGYIDIDAGPGYAGITLYGWAYESQPNTPIFAGSVPEPSRMVLLLTGALAMIYQRRRRQSEPH